ncbi:hypothetical protein LCGC14_0094630 [marine sediment metagenome]|uniref:Uncharacterized protein n=1 Tax=marine sediment metagenome TaxID=412755 RepID=A0A0F9VUC5_9ZZZZ|nr:hypothetical protein [Phycisphaerae bacterium]HDZ44004.1 hypothetical protein [Phycisphaerae bacterium]
MMDQPDFTDLFNTYFASTSRPICYEVRRDANRGHDLVFLSSLVHDARFPRDAVSLDGQTLTIPMDRDRWEDFREKNALWSVAATLTIGGVVSHEWRLTGDGPPSADDAEFCLRDLYIGEREFRADDDATPTFPLILTGCFEWELAIELDKRTWSIRLADAE